jgi:hypothetical protein
MVTPKGTALKSTSGNPEYFLLGKKQLQNHQEGLGPDTIYQQELPGIIQYLLIYRNN